MSIDKKWEDLSGGAEAKKPITPLHAIDYEDDTEVLEWFSNTEDILTSLYDVNLVDDWASQLAMYQGLPTEAQVAQPRDQLRPATPSPKMKKIVVSHAYELAEQWVSKLMRFKPSIAVLPVNAEHNDRVSAKLAKKVLDHLFVLNNMDQKIEQMERAAKVFGESYMYVYYDPDKGDLHPDQVAIDKQGKKLKVPDVESEDGGPLFVEKKIRVGDIVFKVMNPWQVLLPMEECFDDVDYCILEFEEDIDKLKAEYPEKADEIKETPYSSHSNEGSPEGLTNKIKVWEVYHKSTNLIDSGRYIKLTRGAILENDVHPYSHKELPIVRLTDIDTPSRLHGQSFIKIIRPLALMYNKITSYMWRNFAFGAHPKWLVQTGSTNLVNLGNAMTIVEYSSQVPPRLEAFPTIPPEMFRLREELRNEMEKLSGIHSVSRGEPPPGIRAGIALQFLEEQENQRAHSAIIKHNAMIRQVAKQAISLVGDWYDPSDGRLIRIVGRNDQFSVKALDKAKLSGPYDIRIQNTSALPQSKAGRIQTLIELRQTFGPTVVPDDQVIDMLDLGQPEKYFDYASVAIQKAESENEDLLDPDMEEIPSPQDYEEHVVHWQTHMKAIQSRSFGDDVPQETKERMFDHIRAHEFLMFEKAFGDQANPMFKQKLMTLEGWPIFFQMPDPEPQPQAGGLPPEVAAALGGPSEELPPDPNALPPVPTGEDIPAGAGLPVELPLPPETMPNIPIPER